jgi:hypothetical protein
MMQLLARDLRCRHGHMININDLVMQELVRRRERRDQLGARLTLD